MSFKQETGDCANASTKQMTAEELEQAAAQSKQEATHEREGQGNIHSTLNSDNGFTPRKVLILASDNQQMTRGEERNEIFITVEDLNQANGLTDPKREREEEFITQEDLNRAMVGDLEQEQEEKFISQEDLNRAIALNNSEGEANFISLQNLEQSIALLDLQQEQDLISVSNTPSENMAALEEVNLVVTSINQYTSEELKHEARMPTEEQALASGKQELRKEKEGGGIALTNEKTYTIQESASAAGPGVEKVFQKEDRQHKRTSEQDQKWAEEMKEVKCLLVTQQLERLTSHWNVIGGQIEVLEETLKELEGEPERWISPYYFGEVYGL